jgi:hypothetical protein
MWTAYDETGLPGAGGGDGGQAKKVEDATGCHSVLETGLTAERAFPALLWALDLAP